MELPVNKSSPVPVHYQLYELLKDKILSGELAPGEKMPLEQEIVRETDLSRLTVRQAFQLLVDEGLVRRVRNRGSFVRTVRIGSPSGHINSFSGSLRHQGFNPGAEVLATTPPGPLPQLVRAAFGHVEDELMEAEFGHIRRLILANDRPILISDYYFNTELLPKIQPEEITSPSLYEMMTRHGITVHEADQAIILSEVKAKDAKLLGIPPGSITMVVNRADYAADGLLVGLVRNVLHPDACSLRYAVVGAGLTSIRVGTSHDKRAA